MFRLVLASFLILPSLFAAKSSYQYIRVGNAADVGGATTPGTVLMGGGTDVDAAFQWMCARSGGGDFLVLRATGTDAYNPYIRRLCPAGNSVATLIIGSLAAANDPAVASIINKAEAIWFAGGDQSNYVNYWTGTGVQTAIANRITAVPVGGTSAGLNILTQFIYSAQLSQGVTSSQALADPYSRYITFARNFVNIPALANIIGDPHFATRDRMGRDLAFLCRMQVDGWVTTTRPRGISVDEATALLIDQSGVGTVTGTGRVYFLEATVAPDVCAPKTPLTYRHVSVRRIAKEQSFDVANWTGSAGVTYSVSAVAGVLSSTQLGGNLY